MLWSANVVMCVVYEQLNATDTVLNIMHWHWNDGRKLELGEGWNTP